MLSSHGHMTIRPDPWILGVTAATAAFGVLMVYDASAVSAALRHRFDNPVFFLERQLVWFAVGLVCMLAASRIPLHRIQHGILPVTMVLVILMVLVLIPGIGHAAGGARRWLRLGPLSLQPGELMRLVLALYLAHLFSVKADRIRDFRQGFLPAVTISGIAVILLAAQPKFGTSLILIILTGVMLFAAGTPLVQLGSVGLCAIPFLGYAVFNVGYIQDRIAAWLNPAEHARGAGFQMMQSLIAIGSGGFTGAGLGQGRQKMFYLPESHTDMIFPVIAEELGLLGSILVLTAFSVLLFRGLDCLPGSKPVRRYSGGGIDHEHTDSGDLKHHGRHGIVSGNGYRAAADQFRRYRSGHGYDRHGASCGNTPLGAHGRDQWYGWIITGVG